MPKAFSADLRARRLAGNDEGARPANLAVKSRVGERWVYKLTKMTRTRRRAPRGAPLVDCVPQGHWKTTTFLAGLRLEGLSAPRVVDGAIKRTGPPPKERARLALHGEIRDQSYSSCRESPA